MFPNRLQNNGQPKILNKRRQQMTSVHPQCVKHIAKIVLKESHMIKFMTSSIYFILPGAFPMQLFPHTIPWKEIEEIQFLIIKLCPVN